MAEPKYFTLSGAPHPASLWPDSSGFEHDIEPTGGQIQDELYGVRYIPPTPSGQYNSWTNWTRKPEVDGRFAAVSDANAHTYPFPEVEAPWRFARYVYRGLSLGGKSAMVVEPQLYSDETLLPVNSVTRRRTTTRAKPHILHDYYWKGEDGVRYTTEQLDKGIDGGPPWQDSKGSHKFTPDGANPRVDFNAAFDNSGVDMYLAEVPVQSVKHGAHGNIPPHVVAMQSNPEWLEPPFLYTGRAVPKVKMSVGSPLYLPRRTVGELHFNETTSTGVTGVSIQSPLNEQWVDAENFAKYFRGEAQSVPYVVPSGTEGALLIGRPHGLRETVLRLRMTSQNYASQDFAHEGCTHWVGSQGFARCVLKDQGEPLVTPGLCMTASDDAEAVKASFASPSGQAPAERKLSWNIPPSGICPFYSPNTPRVIASYEALAATPEELAALRGLFAVSERGGTGYERGGGAKNAMNAKGMFDGTFGNTALMAMGGGGAMSAGLALGGLAYLLKPVTTPREAGDYDVRYDITWEYIKEPSMGRETTAKAFFQEGSLEEIKLGTGVMAFDTQASSYRGLDTHIPGDINLMSHHRFMGNTLPCYKAEQCNPAHGKTSLCFESIPGVFSDVAKDIDNGDVTKSWCRYYNWTCPRWNMERRAHEYSMSYQYLIDNILKPFRARGIGAFPGFTEHRVSDGVYKAKGSKPPGMIIHGETLFLYTKSMEDENHVDSDVFAYILHYDHDGNQCMKDGKPWLVKLEDDYRPPTGFFNVVDNRMKFIGGRAPEYKDMSMAYDMEIMCGKNMGGGIEADASRPGAGDPRGIEDTGGDFLIGYFVERAGKYIIDGRPLGSIGARIGSPGGANAISGHFSNSYFTPDYTAKMRQVNCWVYGADTSATYAELVENPPTLDLASDDGSVENRPCPPAPLPEGIPLPSEREWNRCGTCGLTILPGDPDYDVGFSGGNTCPVCKTGTIKKGKWTNFAPCKAMGIVDVWAPPGQVVRLDGFYFSAPTPVSIDTFTEAVDKLGPPNQSGGGYILGGGSSGAESESDIKCPPRPSGVHIIHGGGLEKEEKFSRASIDSSVDITPNSPFNPISPWDSSTPQSGKFVGMSALKKLRDAAGKCLAYAVGSNPVSDFGTTKQAGHKKRYDIESKTWPGKRTGLAPQILGANSTGGAYFDEFWDGKLPGKSIVTYYPWDPCWWRIHNVMGFLSQSDADQNPDHFGGAKEMRAGVMYWLTGWVPLDKEVDKAYAIFSPSFQEPSAEPVGITWSGRRLTRHVHPFLSYSDDDRGLKASRDYLPTDRYYSSTPDRTTPYGVEQNIISSFTDWSFGIGLPGQSFLQWSGCGFDLVQNTEEDAIWKSMTFAQFKSKVSGDTMDIAIMCGDPGTRSHASYKFTMMSKRLLDHILMNDVQPIPKYFDLSGKNSKLLYPRSGPSIADEKTDTSWATNQVLDQGGVSYYGGARGGVAPGPSEWDGGGVSLDSAGRTTRVLDVTDKVKTIYESRYSPVYAAKCGMSIGEVVAARMAEHERHKDVDPRNVLSRGGYSVKDGGSEEPQDAYGLCLIGGDLPQLAAGYPVATPDNGDPYSYSSEPLGRVVQCSDHHKPFGSTPPAGQRSRDAGTDLWFKFHPSRMDVCGALSNDDIQATCSPEEGGSITRGEGSAGFRVRFAANPSPPYTFSEWQVVEGVATLSPGSSSKSVLVASAEGCKLAAVFKEPLSCLDVSRNNQDVVIDPEGTVATGRVLLGVGVSAEVPIGVEYVGADCTEGTVCKVLGVNEEDRILSLKVTPPKNSNILSSEDGYIHHGAALNFLETSYTIDVMGEQVGKALTGSHSAYVQAPASQRDGVPVSASSFAVWILSNCGAKTVLYGQSIYVVPPAANTRLVKPEEAECRAQAIFPDPSGSVPAVSDEKGWVEFSRGNGYAIVSRGSAPLDFDPVYESSGCKMLDGLGENGEMVFLSGPEESSVNVSWTTGYSKFSVSPSPLSAGATSPSIPASLLATRARNVPVPVNAMPSRGYVFDKWIVSDYSGEKSSGNVSDPLSASTTATPTGKSLAVVAVFKRGVLNE